MRLKASETYQLDQDIVQPHGHVSTPLAINCLDKKRQCSWLGLLDKDCITVHS